MSVSREPLINSFRAGRPRAGRLRAQAASAQRNCAFLAFARIRLATEPTAAKAINQRFPSESAMFSLLPVEPMAPPHALQNPMFHSADGQSIANDTVSTIWGRVPFHRHGVDEKLLYLAALRVAVGDGDGLSDVSASEEHAVQQQGRQLVHAHALLPAVGQR